MNAPIEIERDLLTECTAQIATAYVTHNDCARDALPDLISGIGAALASLGQPAQPEEIFEPAVNPKRSITPDHLISLIDGKPYKMLKRHLGLHGLTPEEYRARYGLPADYPMVAANYSERRAKLAKEIGLGTKANRGQA